jgi:hypothetical protein
MKVRMPPVYTMCNFQTPNFTNQTRKSGKPFPRLAVLHQSFSSTHKVESVLQVVPTSVWNRKCEHTNKRARTNGRINQTFQLFAAALTDLGRTNWTDPDRTALDNMTIREGTGTMLNNRNLFLRLHQGTTTKRNPETIT